MPRSGTGFNLKLDPDGMASLCDSEFNGADQLDTRRITTPRGLPVVAQSSQRTMPLPSQFLARLAFWAALFAMLCGIPSGMLAADPVTSSFTDSQGRTTLYRYSLKDDWHSSQPRGVLIFLHGNNVGTQEDMVEWLPQDVAYQHDLVPVAVASPEAQPLGGIQWNLQPTALPRIWNENLDQ